jgi:hypothetical protein
MFYITESRCTGKARWYANEVDVYGEIEPNEDCVRVVKYEEYERVLKDMKRLQAELSKRDQNPSLQACY